VQTPNSGLLLGAFKSRRRALSLSDDSGHSRQSGDDSQQAHL
jgi:hypothetical protein